MTLIDKHKEDQQGSVFEFPPRLPVLPLRDVVLFPGTVYPLLIGRPASLRVIDEAIDEDKLVLLLSQKDPAQEDIDTKSLFRMGVVGRIIQLLRLPAGLTKILVEAIDRAKIDRMTKREGIIHARFQIFIPLEEEEKRIKAGSRKIKALFSEYIAFNRNLPDELLLPLDRIQHPQQIADYISAYTETDYLKKQPILEAKDLNQQHLLITSLLKEENEILKLEKSIDSITRDKMSKSQRVYYLHEQMKAIRRELGEESDEEEDDLVVEYKEKIRKARMTAEAEEKAYEELERLINMAELSPEATVVRSYLDWLCSLPWSKRTRENIHIEKARTILDEDHYGLEKPKERILEHLSVLKLVKNIKGPILCLVGPPGVGKTSLGISVARAMNRKFVRVSLGGVRDEAEIRGHRRTYIGSLPGRIIQSLKKAGSRNPVFLLDEVDKMSADFRGDPASALLEALDPEQNSAFLDHYLDVDFDLSHVLFITTANHEDGIPPALLDRMEIIRLPGYLRNEKLHIANIFLLPKQMKANGLKKGQLEITRQAMLHIIDEYTREAGVRELERYLAKICRKVARKTVEKKSTSSTRLKLSHLRGYLGVPPYPDRKLSKGSKVGRATGLAWTSVGGDILSVDVALLQGKSGLIMTGRLGDVMKESARAALSYLRKHAETLGIDKDAFRGREVHLHIPEGAVPKDGPSAGITIAAALYSAASGKPLPQDVAMTGEITLRGEILAIGGLAEKLIAAKRNSIKKVLIPLENLPQLSEVSSEVKRGLNVTPIENLDQLWSILVPGE
ncbi:endopeptidase La [candidate division LCP-89 bacterium B3_LCP]|uniref:Lon protease n=1 Tax=candidate division LCP-89 bacterium B3_LCP TaxID=2012998 RepID=A0A532V411_UNCL8|nr:MAG: endopeptidase La [candidate division LCP-89 bacterium B3_LCP]